MIRILKNLKIKLFFILCMFTILLSTLLRINYTDLVTTLRGIYGGISLNTLSAKMGFIFLIILLQYANADTITYYLNNNSYLATRYGSRKKLIRVLLKKILGLNLTFVCLVGIAVVFSAVLSRLSLSVLNYMEILEVLLRGYLTCVTISIIQVILMFKTAEAKTFMILMIVSISLTFLSQFNQSFFTIRPVPLEGMKLPLNILICVISIAFCTIYTKETFCKNEQC